MTDFRKKMKELDRKQKSVVVFFDESSIQQFSVRTSSVCCTMGNMYEEIYANPTVKYLKRSMVLSAMSVSCSHALYFILPKTTMNGNHYLDLIRDKLKLHV